MLALGLQQSALMQSGMLLAGSGLSDFTAISGQISNELRLNIDATDVAQNITPAVEGLVVDESTPATLATAHSMLSHITHGHIPVEHGALENALQSASSIIQLFSMQQRMADTLPDSLTQPPSIIPESRLSHPTSRHLTARLRRASTMSMAPVTLEGQENVSHCAVCESANDISHQFCKDCGFPMMEVEEISPQKIDGTMIFGDLSGFSSYVEKTTEDVLFPTINEIQAGLAAQVLSMGGYVIGYWGDAIFAVFGMDKHREDDAERAVRCALRMQQFMQQRNAGLAEENQIHLRLGINTGRVSKGIMGGAGRKILTVLGNQVNIAARLEPLAKPGGIVISRATMLRTSHAFEENYEGLTQVKNIIEPVEYYEVTGEKPGAIVGTRRGEEVQFMGRTTELVELEARHKLVTDLKKPHFTLIEGGAGMGKSRLVEEFLATLPSVKGHSLIAARGENLPALRPYRVMINALRRLANIDDTDELEDAREKLRTLVRLALGTSDELEFIEQVLGNLIGLSYEEMHPRMEVLVSDAKALRDETFEALIALFEGLSRNQNIILLLEDLHWFDPGTESLIRSMMDRLEDRAIHVIGLARPRYRSGNPELLTGEYSVDRIILDRMDETTLIEMFDQISRTPLDDEERSFVLDESGGSPFMVQEIARGIRDDWKIVKDETTGRMGFQSPDGKSVTMGAEALLLARVDGLPPDEREILEAAAVVGGTFTYRDLEPILGGYDEHSLENLAGAQLLLRVGEGEYQFYHAMLRDAVYNKIGQRVAKMHRLIAQGMLACNSNDLPAIASHFERGNRDIKAARFYYKAAKKAYLREGENESAIKFYTTVYGLSVAERPELALKALIGLSEVSLSYSRYNEALEYILKGQDLLDREDISTEVIGKYYYQYATVLLNRRDEKNYADTAIDVAKDGLKLFTPSEQSLSKAWLLHFIGRTYTYEQQKYALGEKYTKAALQLALSVGDDEIIAECHVDLVVLAMQHSDYVTALHHIEKAIPLVSTPDLARRRMKAIGSKAGILINLGKYDEALELYLETEKLSKERFKSDSLAEILSNLAMTAYRLHDPRAKEFMLRASELYMKQPVRFFTGVNYLYASLIYMAEGNLDKAHQAANDSLGVAYKYGNNDKLASMAYMARAQVYLRMGNYADALEDSTKAYQILKKYNMAIEEYDLEIMLTHSRVLHANGQVDDGWHVIDATKKELNERAKKLSDEDLKDSFLNNVEVNQTIIQWWETLRRASSADDQGAFERIIAPHLPFHVPTELPPDMARYANQDPGRVSGDSKYNGGAIAGVILNIPIVDAVRGVMEEDIEEIPENLGKPGSLWYDYLSAQGISWKTMKQDGKPAALVTFKLGHRKRIVGPVLKAIEALGFATNYEIKLVDDLEKDGEVLRMTMKVDPDESNVSPSQFGPLEFSFAMLGPNRSLITLHMKDTDFTQHPRVVLLAFARILLRKANESPQSE